MDAMILDNFEKNALMSVKFDLKDKMETFNKSFQTKLLPENGMYGVTEIIKEDGIVQRTFRNNEGLLRRDYLKNDKLYQSREKMSDGSWVVTKYDDNGTGYLKTIMICAEIGLKKAETSLIPNTKIEKGNFTSYIDDKGRPCLNKVNNVKIKEIGRDSLNIQKDTSYRESDHRGHLIADSFGGPTSPENIVPQAKSVNLSKMAKVENLVRDYVKKGAEVDYEIKMNYVGDSKRPTSFEPVIKVDGKVIELPKELKKFYNENSITTVEKVTIDLKEGIEKVKPMAVEAHSLGKQEGLETATITFAVSTVDNVSKFIQGEISAEEMVMDIVKDTGTAGAIGYGTAFISSTVSQTMVKSGRTFIQSLGKSGLPSALISFGIDSYDSISDYIQGNIDSVELLYHLGDSAATIAGSMAGSAMAGAAVGSVIPGAGTVVGATAGIVGGMVGCVLASEAYVTAIDAGTKGAEILMDKAQEFANSTIELAEKTIPNNVSILKEAFYNFVNENRLSYHL